MSDVTIDVSARRLAADTYCRFEAGMITNFELEKLLPRSSERGLRDIFLNGVWPLYDDLREYKLTGRDRLTPEGRKHVARIILFLHGELPYRWPCCTGWRFLVFWLCALLTFGLWYPLRQRMRDSGGDGSVWPFFTRAEYEVALQFAPSPRGVTGS